MSDNDKRSDLQPPPLPAGPDTYGSAPPPLTRAQPDVPSPPPHAAPPTIAASASSSRPAATPTAAERFRQERAQASSPAPETEPLAARVAEPLAAPASQLKPNAPALSHPKQNSSAAVWVLLLLVVLAGGGGGGYYLYTREQAIQRLLEEQRVAQEKAQALAAAAKMAEEKSRQAAAEAAAEVERRQAAEAEALKNREEAESIAAARLEDQRAVEASAKAEKAKVEQARRDLQQRVAQMLREGEADFAAGRHSAAAAKATAAIAMDTSSSQAMQLLERANGAQRAPRAQESLLVATSGTWSGSYQCGPSKLVPQPPNPAGFTTRAHLTLANGVARLMRSGQSPAYEEILTGRLTADGRLELNGAGSFEGGRGPWRSVFVGRYVPADSKIEASGQLSTLQGQLTRECRFELRKQ